MNDTMGENGLVPSRIVFGIIPRFPILNTELPTQKQRMEIIKSAQAEMNSIVAERRVLAALTRDIPPAADRNYKLGEEVLVYSEKEKKWIGPYIVVDSTGRQVTIRNTEGTKIQMFNAFQIKPYYRTFHDNIYHFKSDNDALQTLYTTLITEVIEPKDARAWKFDKPIQKEIKGLLKRKHGKLYAQVKYQIMQTF